MKHYARIGLLFTGVLLSSAAFAPAGFAQTSSDGSRPLGYTQPLSPQGQKEVQRRLKELGARSVRALDGVDLDVAAGEVHCLLGQNGAGKSTMINILAGLVNKTAGKVTIWGFDQDVNPRQSRAAIGVMPQELNMDPFFTPRASLEVQAGLYGVPKSERWTDELLELVGLTDQANAYARNLSGGMRRRLLLAKALVHRPQILVLDDMLGMTGRVPRFVHRFADLGRAADDAIAAYAAAVRDRSFPAEANVYR